MILIYFISLLFSGFVQLATPQLTPDTGIHETPISIDLAVDKEQTTQNSLYFKEEGKHSNHFHLLLTEPDTEDKLHFKNFNKKYFSLSLSNLHLNQITTFTFPLYFNNKSWQVHAVPYFIWNQVFRL